MINKTTIILVIALIVILTGCMQERESKPNDTPREDKSPAPEKAISVISANNLFAFDLYSKFNKDEDSNLFFSPYSLSVALTMTYEGARGKTAEEMQSVLHIPENAGQRRNGFKETYDEINKKDKKYKLSTANALWAQKDYKFLKEYLDIAEEYYHGKSTNVDFIDEEEREKSRQLINKWVEEQTNDKIKDLIPQGALDSLTRLVLTNAIYFKGNWLTQFDKKDTTEQDFKTGSGNMVKVPMMSLTKDVEFNYAETNDIQILEMPYDGEELSMIIVLPKENSLKNVEKTLNVEKVSEWKSALVNQKVIVFLPKFRFETKYFMVEMLSEIGMPTAFTESADFSGMDGTTSLLIQNVIHQAFVDVNEEGTEAAAATAVIVGIESVGPVIPVFRADHPFIFIIQERKTGNILFLGKVNDPTK